MFKIARPELLTEMMAALSNQSVVLTGPPGIGKSWLLAAAADAYKVRGQRVLVLAAESYDVANVEELTKRLGLPSDIVAFLHSLGDKILLFIDGLDALRSEASSKTFRTLIEQMMQRAPNVRMLVTIRTFDLEQSYVLRRVLKLGKFRTINVGDLTEQELSSASMQAEQLIPLISTARPAMMKLLRNPFMLRLALSLISDGISYELLGSYSSEVQLLARFWRRRVETAENATSRRWILSSIVQRMSDNKLLSTSTTGLLGLIKSSREESTFARLQSDEILRERSDRIMFDHNILFDYAASRLLLTLESLLPMMRDDASRTIFLRASIGYFYTGLWIHDRENFWKLFRETADPENRYQERLTVEPANVVAANLSNADDISLLTTWPRDIRNRATRAILRGVTSDSFSTGLKRAAWNDALEQILNDMQGDYVNEMIRLLNELSEFSLRKEKPRTAALGRQMLYWAWREAEHADSKCDPVALTTVVTGRLLPIILENYSSSPSETRTIVQRLLKQFGQANSSPKNAMYVAWGLKHIVDADPPTAAAVIDAIFKYEETSSEKTEIGSSTIMQFTSDRRQDFEQARYVLQREYPYFVEKAPLEALTAAVQAVEHEVRRAHVSAWNHSPSFTYVYEGITAGYRNDLSEIWDQGYRDQLSLTLLDICLRELLGDEGQKTLPIHIVISALVRQTDLAVAWRHVFSPFLSVDNEVIRALLPLLEIPEFLAAPEITRSIGSYIEKVYSKGRLDVDEKTRIEKAILALDALSNSSRYETTNQTRDHLLARIPPEHLLTAEARELRIALQDEEDNLRNDPYVRSSFGQLGLSNEEFLKMRGVDTGSARSQALLRAVEPIKSFSSSYVNSIPTADDIGAVIDNLKTAWSVLNTEADNSEISQNAAGVIAACAAAIAKNEELTSMGEAAALCREILLALSTHVQPEARPDDKFDHPGWGAPLARIEVAEGVMSYGTHFSADPEVINAIRMLAIDPVPAVRFQIAIRLGMLFKSQPDLFRDLMELMIRREQTAGVLGGLTQTINRIAYANPGLATSLIRTVVALPNYPEIIERFGQDFLLVTLLQLDVFKHSHDAAGLLEELLDATKKNIGAMIRIAHHVRQIVEIQNISSDDRARALHWLTRLVIVCNSALDSFDLVTDPQAYFVNLLKCLETVSFQLMILLDVDSNLRQGNVGLNDTERQIVYERLEPTLIALVLGRTDDLHITPPTAMNVLKIFTKCLAYSPRKILRLAVKAVSAGAQYGFSQDHMAISEFVEFAEVFLADHRDLLREEEIAAQFSDLLDLFVRVGWPQAVQMVMTLDEALR